MKTITLKWTIVLFSVFITTANGQGTWSQTNLVDEGVQMGAASLGGKVYFAGGLRGNSPSSESDRIDIYDVNSMQWTLNNLSTARSFPSTISHGSKVFFAGGLNVFNGAVYSVIDVYDTLTQQWTTEQLSTPRFNLHCVAYGDELLFVGGTSLLLNTNFKIIDKYNVLTDTWTTDSISEERSAMGFALLGHKAYFVGGYILSAQTVSNRIDIYDFTTGQWSSDSLSVARGFLDAVAIGSKLICAGGMVASNTPTDVVDIFDTLTGSWTTANLSLARGFIKYSDVACEKAYFVGGGSFDFSTNSWTTSSDVIDIYDPATNSWSIEHIPGRSAVNHSVVSNANKLFVAGGLDFAMAFSSVDIYTCSPVGVDDFESDLTLFSIFPNPAMDRITISCPSFTIKTAVVKIRDIQGKLVSERIFNLENKFDFNTSEISNGIYIVEIVAENYFEAKKLIIEK